MSVTWLPLLLSCFFLLLVIFINKLAIQTTATLGLGKALIIWVCVGGGFQLVLHKKPI